MRFQAQDKANAVYTPGMMAAGREWRDWRYGSKPPGPDGRVGELAITVSGKDVEANFAAPEPVAEALELHIAVLGFGLSTPVRAGENRGEVLGHDFVVLGYERIAGSGDWRSAIPKAPLAHQAERLAIAAWESYRGNVEPLQAVGGWLD